MFYGDIEFGTNDEPSLRFTMQSNVHPATKGHLAGKCFQGERRFLRRPHVAGLLAAMRAATVFKGYNLGTGVDGLGRYYEDVTPPFGCRRVLLLVQPSTT